MDRTEALSHVLRKLREDKGLTQLVVAGLASISPTSVSNLENHRKGLRMATLFEVCDALGVRASDVVRQAEEEAAKHRSSVRGRTSKPR